MENEVPLTGCLITYGALVMIVVILLAILKLMGMVSFGWLWVLSPIWVFWIVSLICLTVSYRLGRK